jgi:hypothetical protein
VAGILAALAACQPVPQPFAHDGPSRNPVIVPSSDTGGVTVLSVSGAPTATADTLLVAMADSLADHDIPAATGSGNRLSRFVQASASVAPSGHGQLRVELVWDLFDRGGTLLGSEKVSRTVETAVWERPNRRALRSLTDGAAGKIAALILDPSGKGAADRSAPPLHVWPVDGMEAGDGAALREAMETALRRRDFTVFSNLDGAGLVIAGHFTAGPAAADRRPVEITWAVLDAAGQELGKLTQRNAVPVSALESGWKTLAAVIAENAAGGVSDLVRNLPAEALRKPVPAAK